LALAPAIRAARNESGLTQADVAERAGLRLHTVRSAEQGARHTSVGGAAAIAQALGRSLDEQLIALRALARSRGVELDVVLQHALSGELRAIVERPPAQADRR
jgi:transcriptional regulator with XRE-family HTH domain